MTSSIVPVLSNCSKALLLEGLSYGTNWVKVLLSIALRELACDFYYSRDCEAVCLVFVAGYDNRVHPSVYDFTEVILLQIAIL